jgi:hypothetical protein
MRIMPLLPATTQKLSNQLLEKRQEKMVKNGQDYTPARVYTENLRRVNMFDIVMMRF